MTSVTNTLKWLICFALLDLVRPILVAGQDSEFFAAVTQLKPIMASTMAEKPINITPPTTNPFGPAAQLRGQDGSDTGTYSDTLALQLDRGCSTAWLTETYLATPRPFTILHPPEWSNGLAAGVSLFSTRSNTTAFQFMVNFDSSTTNVGGFPFEQFDGSYLTMRWGVSRLFLSNTGRNDLQIDFAEYGERMVSLPRLPVASYMAYPTGEAAYSSGAEATFSLPSRNAVLSIRYGTERVVQPPSHGHLLQFQLSWNW